MLTNPVADFGRLALLLTLVVAAWAGVASAVGAQRGSRRLVASGIFGTYAAAALLTLASTVIFFAILSNDYSIKYVHHYSDATMPWFYKITSYWGGLDGSMMFWAWLLSLFAALAVYVNRERHRDLIPWVITTLMTILAFFLVLLIFQKRPFDTFLTEAPLTGKGLNPLLQNPYMATHPPSLYTGLVSCAVPFAFGMAALITGQLDDAWLRSVRRWVLLSWFFLSLGLTLGMLWAYEVLGWGGYWGWDPVENAGSLAWFTSTAFLHSVMIQERRGMLKVWNVFLVLTSFLLTMVATFLTRSGFVQSVHAFGSDPVLKVAFLSFIAFAAVVGYGLLIHRMPLLRSRGTLDSWVSREFAFLVNNWILLAAALFILFATMFPSLSEAVTGSRVTLATPFYNLWMAPIGLLLLLLTGVGPLIAWRRATPENLLNQFALPVTCAVVTAGGLAFVPSLRVATPIFVDSLRLPVALINFGLCAFVTGTIFQEFWRGARVRQHHTKLDLATSFIGLVARNPRRYGGYFVHLAVVLMFLGFGGGAYKRESDVTLEKGQQTKIGPYTVKFVELFPADTVERKAVVADLVVSDGKHDLGHARPAKWYYPHHEEEPVSHLEILRGLGEDLYLVLNGFDAQAGLVNLKLVINPLVNWIWIGFLLLALGTAVAFLPPAALASSRAASDEGRKQELDGRAGSTLALLFAVGLGGALFGWPHTAHAQHVEGQTVVAKPRSPDENELFHKIVCMCGTCGRELLSDCTCGTAAKMRDEISRQLAAGVSKDDIVARMVARYPKESPLAMPEDKGFNRLAWAAPYATLLLGVGALVLLARRMTRNARAAQTANATRTAAARGPLATATATRSTARAHAHDGALDDDDRALADRLDDELDELD